MGRHFLDQGEQLGAWYDELRDEPPELPSQGSPPAEEPLQPPDCEEVAERAALLAREQERNRFILYTIGGALLTGLVGWGLGKVLP